MYDIGEFESGIIRQPIATPPLWQPFVSYGKFLPNDMQELVSLYAFLIFLCKMNRKKKRARRDRTKGHTEMNHRS